MASLLCSADQDWLRDEGMRQAQQLVNHAAGSSANLQQARTTCAVV